jgi:hypothetical protein
MMASGQESVSAGIFASDQHKALVYFEELGQASDEPPASGFRARVTDKSLALGSGADLPVALSDLEVMEIDEDVEAEPDPPTD